MLKVDDVRIVEKKIVPNAYLLNVAKMMKESGIKDPLSLLPSNTWHEISFLLTTYTSFANCIRRTLIEELPVKCLSIEDENIRSDDVYVINYLLKKNINLIPINQDFNHTNYSIKLLKKNNTTDIIDVKASDIKLVLKSGEFKKDKVDISLLIPEQNIILARLRPGHKLEINNMKIINGFSKNDASRFSLLDNVSYEITDMVPFDIHNKTGDRSITKDPTKFKLSATTTGNIKPVHLIELLCSTLEERFNKCKKNITAYKNESKESKIYASDQLTVSYKNDIYEYRFIGEYVTIIYPIAHRAFMNDPNVPFCTPSVERYDTEIGIIKINHNNPNELLLGAIDSILEDIKILRKALNDAVTRTM
jgi:hypothetical protein